MPTPRALRAGGHEIGVRMSNEILPDAPRGHDRSALGSEHMAKSLHELYRQWVADGRPRRIVSPTSKTTTS